MEICCSVFCCCRCRCQEDAVVITARGRAVPHHCDGETRHMHQGTCLTFSRSRTKTLSPKDKPASAYAPAFFFQLTFETGGSFLSCIAFIPPSLIHARRCIYTPRGLLSQTFFFFFFAPPVSAYLNCSNSTQKC